MSKLYSILLTAFLALPAHAKDADITAKLEGDKVLGKASAKVTIIEYASLSCPHCAAFHAEIMPVIQKEYIDTGKAKFIFRDYPLNEPAFIGAKVVHCAGKKDDKAYYNALKTLFATQNEWAFDKEFKPKLQALAKPLGLDEKAFEACLADKELEVKILTSRKEGTEKLKVAATPSIYLNGELAEHVHTPDEFRKAMKTVLSGKSLRAEAKEAAVKITKIQPDDMVMGKKNAEVTVVEYANLACPHCGEMHKMLISTLKKDYIDTGKVNVVFRGLSYSPAGFYADMLAQCKGKEGYFDALDVITSETQQWAGTPAFLPILRTIAEKLDISGDAFSKCLENKDIERKVLKYSEDASGPLGIKHSPTFYINGEKIEDMNNAEAVRKAVDSALKK